MVVRQRRQNLFLFALLLLIPLVFESCPLPMLDEDGKTLTNKGNAAIGSVRSFWADNLVTGVRYQLLARKVAEGTSCAIYLDNNASVNLDLIPPLIDKFDNNILGMVTHNYAEPKIINEDGKIILLLLEIIDGGDNNQYVAGYFSATDMMEHFAHSNRASMLFIDSLRGLGTSSSQQSTPVLSDTLITTVAHELQHLVNYSFHQERGQTKGMDAWIDEGLATTAEFLSAGSHRLGRISNYSDNETVKNGNTFLMWDEARAEFKSEKLANYSTAYLFFMWMRMHSNAANSMALFTDILHSDYTDYRAVVSVARQRITFQGFTWSGDDIEDWASLYGFWLKANAAPSNTVYGYTESGFPNIQVRSPDIPIIDNGVILLYPGEAVYSGLLGAPPANSGVIRYLTVGDKLISYNIVPRIKKPFVPEYAKLGGTLNSPQVVPSKSAPTVIDARSLTSTIRPNVVSVPQAKADSAAEVVEACPYCATTTHSAMLNAEYRRVVVSGDITSMGNFPFTDWALVDDGGKAWYTDDEGKKIFSKHKGKRITVEGVAEEKSLPLAGKNAPSITRFYIRDIALIEQ